MRSLLAVFAALIWSVHSQAAELQGVGIFQTLNKPWFLTALYTTEVSAADKSAVTEAPQPERLEFKVVEDKISAYRFRQLWQEAFAVVHGDDIWNTYAADLGVFFDLLKGPLKTNDHLIIEQNNGAAVVSLNYREHARLSSGFLPLLLFTAFISINLAFVNILPIPGLDGGHLLIILLEGISRREFSVKARIRIQQVGMVFLMLLIVSVLYNDIARLITG